MIKNHYFFCAFFLPMSCITFAAQKKPISPVADQKNVQRLIDLPVCPLPLAPKRQPLKTVSVSESSLANFSDLDQSKLSIYDKNISKEELLKRFTELQRKNKLIYRINGSVISQAEKEKRRRESSDIYAMFCYKNLPACSELQEKFEKLMELRFRYLRYTEVMDKKDPEMLDLQCLISDIKIGFVDQFWRQQQDEIRSRRSSRSSSVLPC